MASNTPASVAAATMITAYSAVMAPDSGLASTTLSRACKARTPESIAWLMRTYKAAMKRLERFLILCNHRNPLPAAGHVAVGTNWPPACLACRWKTVAISCEYVIVLTFAFSCSPTPVDGGSSGNRHPVPFTVPGPVHLCCLVRYMWTSGPGPATCGQLNP